jgi:transposase-like protein
MIKDSFFKDLAPVEAEMIRDYVLHEMCPELEGTANAENLNRSVKRCAHCGSERIIRYGYNNKTQRFECKNCGRTFSSTTGTMFYASNTDFETWSAFIDCEVKGLTLSEEAYTIHKSRTTCFNMRQKLYKAAEKVQRNVLLKGDVEMDCTFLPINFKGTKPSNMIRRSKRRGKHKRAIHKTKTENKEPQLCIYTALDEDDNIVFRAANCGGERESTYMKYDKFIDKKACIIGDRGVQLRNYIRKTNRPSDLIPVDEKDRLIFTTENGNSLARVNEMHSELKKEWRYRHGISVRHIQGYIDWLVYLKNLKYQVEGMYRKHRAYIDLMAEKVPFINRLICRLPFPVDVNEVYGDKYNGIYAFS